MVHLDVVAVVAFRSHHRCTAARDQSRPNVVAVAVHHTDCFLLHYEKDWVVAFVVVPVVVAVGAEHHVAVSYLSQTLLILGSCYIVYLVHPLG